MISGKFAYLAAVPAIAAALPAHAQTSPSFGIELATDEARRGLSWSEGRVALSADAMLNAGVADVSARIASTRGSVRHAGADAVADLELGTRVDVGAINLRFFATGHIFAGASAPMDYAEIGTNGSFTIGPLRLDGGAVYAPSQTAIGGDNLYLFAGASSAIPATAFLVSAKVGRSSGSVDDTSRAARMRPGGTYLDWQVGIERTVAPLTLGVDYIGTDISRNDAASPFADAPHSGDRLVARVRLAF